MKALDGIHHITAITGDARANLRFYTEVLGLRLVKKSINQDDVRAYHLFYGDEEGTPGADLTFFEYPGVQKGRSGAGMIHRVGWRVGSVKALEWWERRLADKGIGVQEEEGRIVFEDPEGLEMSLEVDKTGERPLMAKSREIEEEYALQGFAGVRAYSERPLASRRLLGETLGFKSEDNLAYASEGENRSAYYIYDKAPLGRGMQGAGSVHHIAWACEIEEQEKWRDKIVLEGHSSITPVIDRFYFKSVYFREPSGVLFEIATKGPGFTIDEDREHLGEKLSLPPSYEYLRAEAEARLIPLRNLRLGWV